MNTAHLRLTEAQLQLPQQSVSLPAITLARGEIIAVMGPSGCGKSSWLRWLLGDQQNHLQVNGQIELAGNDLTTKPIEQRGIGIVWQDFLLFPHLSVAENLQIALPARHRKLSPQAQQQLIVQRLEHVELAALLQQPVATLSGGQRARIALVRTLINEPQLLLLDEPFAALDSNLRQRIRDWTFSTLSEAGTSAIIVSHDRNDFPLGCSCLAWPHGVTND
jgi:putative thiamine transport system ATP-binding protein